MKKKIIIIIVSVILVAALSVGTVFVIKACNKKDDDDKKTETPEVTLNETSVDVVFGDTYTIVAGYKDIEGLTLTWSSDNESVATVDGGKITAVGAGSAKIKATYGEATAECTVNVGFSDYMPELKIRHLSEDKIRMSLNSDYDLEAFVYFNGKEFPCEFTGATENAGVVTFGNGKLTAVGLGTSEVTVKTEWNSFDNALTEKTITVEVINEIILNSVVTVGGNATATDKVSLSLIPEFAGNSYDSSATVNFTAKENGVKSSFTGTVVSGDDVISFENGAITAKGFGTATVLAEYTDASGNKYSYTFTVEVYIPVVKNDEQIEVCVKNAFPVEQLFGNGAVVISARQNGAELTVSGGVIDFTPNGKNTADLEVVTDKGGYLFTNVFAYTAKITNATEFKNAFGLVNNAVADGYYVLGNDVDGIVASSYQTLAGNKNTYFKGTLDGCGYTVTATAGANGLFGSLANGAVIKNAKFVLTFPDSQACGFAKNTGTFNQEESNVSLENLYVETTNYYADSTVLMDQRQDKLAMKDVFVKINGNAALGEYTDSDSHRNALFRLDQAMNDGRYGQFNGEFRRIYVVTETFIPVACGGNWKGWTFASYAVNDVEKLGLISRNNNKADNWAYCKVANMNPDGDAKSKLFGYEDPESANGRYTFIYGARTDISDGGVYRYDTVAELKESGVLKVGDWTVA